MPKRLAITIAGAVSLGSYEAGVLYEVLDAIHHHNLDARTTDETRIVIDVLTGASAGGMTALILAHKLLYAASEFAGPYNNPLYNVWVKRINLADLQSPRQDESALRSLLSSDLVEKISHDMLLARYDSPQIPVPDPHGAVGKELRVGVAMTNLNGVDYGLDVEPQGQKFVYREYADQMTRTITASDDNKGFWEPLSQAAVACGAFPIAFRAHDVVRSTVREPRDYPGTNLLPWKSDPRIFTYSDGGILQNQPIGMAKNLVDEIDNHEDQESRYYLFVSPNAKDAAPAPPFHEADADYFHLVGHLLKAVIGQSGFRDWITAQAMNDRIDKLDARAEGLMQAILDGKIDIACLQTTADALLDLLFPDGKHTPPGAYLVETLDGARKRISTQYLVELQKLTQESTAAAEAFRDAILTFETAAGLGARDMMRIYGVTSTHSELAGAGLQAFVGFFDQAFRDHDYDIGRSHAQTVLMSTPLSGNGEIGPIYYQSQVIRPIDASLNGLKLRQVSIDDLNAFKSGITKRANQMLEELLGPYLSLIAKPGVDPLIRGGLDMLIHNS